MMRGPIVTIQTAQDELFGTMSYMLKVVVAGETYVGKTALIQRFVADRFVTGTRNTIGVDFFLKQLSADEVTGLEPDEELHLQVWDVSGEQRFREILPLYSSGTQGLVLCFDTQENLEQLWEWERTLQFLIPPPTPRILLKTKCDLGYKVDQAKVEEFKTQFHCVGPFESSAKEGFGVRQAFAQLANEIFATINKSDVEQPS